MQHRLENAMTPNEKLIHGAMDRLLAGVSDLGDSQGSRDIKAVCEALTQSWSMLERGSVNCRAYGGMMPPGEAAAHAGTEGRETSPATDAVPVSREARPDSSPNTQAEARRDP
jgi:hypothetical protein